MLVFSKKNLAFSKKLHWISFYLSKEAKKRTDPDARKDIQTDAKAIKDIADKLMKHNPAAASALMFKLDRVLLDHAIPVEIFNYLEDYCGR